jgi:hypothetical protein
MKRFFSKLPGWLMAGLLAITCLASFTVRAQAPAWQMATAASTASAKATATDASGNVYVVGSFYGTTAFGSHTLTSAGASDIFIAKWDPLANGFAWALRAGGARFDDEAYGVAVNGNAVYVTGGFSSATADFGPVLLANTASTGGGADVFVTKLTDTGSVVWAQRAGGLSGGDEGRSIAVSGSNIYITGRFFSTTASFSTTTLANANPGFPYSPDAYVAKLSDAGSAGTFVWAQAWGGRNEEGAFAVAVSGSTVYVAGAFTNGFVSNTSPANFGPFTLVSQGPQNGYVAKFADAGLTVGFVWVQQISSFSYCGALAMAVSGSAVYLAGAFNFGSVFLGPITLRNASLANTYDGFVARLDDAGTTSSFAWAQRFGGQADEEAMALAVNGPNVYLAGYFASSSLSLGATTLLNSRTGYEDVFVAKLTATGSIDWVAGAGGISTDRPAGLAVSGPTVYVCGLTYPPALFGTLAISSPSGSSAGFLASLTDPTLLGTTLTTGNLAFALFPNPAQSATTVQLPAVRGGATATLTLTDALGRILRTATLPAASLRHELDLRGLSPGLYAVQVRVGGTRGTQRLVVE